MHRAVLIFLLAIVCCIVVIDERIRRKRLSRLLNRSCAGRDWRRAFPVAGKDDIRRYLKLFAEAFGLPQEHYLAFRPADRIMDVYHALNPTFVLVDGMELELFLDSVEERYTLSPQSFCHVDLTLGDLFDRTRTG